MAGIGFKLRQMVEPESYLSLVKAYGYSGLVASGAWIIATGAIIIAILFINFDFINELYIRQFQVTITFLIVNSFVLSSFAQHSYTRYVSDRLFEKKMGRILPSLISISLVITAVYGVLAYLLVDWMFPKQTYLYRLFFCASFVMLVNIWPSTNLLVGLKKTNELLFSYLLGYGVMLVCAFFLKESKLVGLMFSFFLGQFFLFGALMLFIVKNFFSDELIDFEFYSRQKTHFSLAFVSLFFNLGCWIDKYIFWYYPETGFSVIGIIHASTVYDLPMFVAFMLMIPAFTVFVFRVEIDFAIYYDYYYDAIRSGGSFREILEKRDQLVAKSTEAIMDTLKVQGLVLLFVFLFGAKIMNYFGIPDLHYYLLRIDVLSVTFFLILIAILNILFYLDRRREALQLTAFLLITNTLFTLITLKLGVLYYGYGFCLSLFLSCLGGIYYLDQDFRRLEFKAFMQRY